MSVENYSGTSSSGQFHLQITHYADLGDTIRGMLAEILQEKNVSDQEINRIELHFRERMGKLADKLADTVSLTLLLSLAANPKAFDLAMTRLNELNQELAEGSWADRIEAGDHPPGRILRTRLNH